MSSLLPIAAVFLGLTLAGAVLFHRHTRIKLVLQRLNQTAPSSADRLQRTGDTLDGLPFGAYLNAQLVRAGAERFAEHVAPYVLLVLLASAAATAFVHVWLGILGLALGVAVPLALLQWIQRKRLNEFIDRLPIFLERVRQLILIGNAFQYAFLRAVGDADPICKRYLDGLAMRVQHGASFTESLRDFAQRLNIPDVYMLSACVEANSKYGGRISRNLANLITQLNNKRRLASEMRAATAETRTSVAMLLLLTGGLMAFVFARSPDSVAFFLGDPAGRPLLFLIVGMPLLGLLLMQRLMKIEL